MRRLLPLATVASVTAFTSLVAVEPVNAVTINTFPSWDGGFSIYDWGLGGSTPTYGQRITVDDPLGLILDSFNFAVKINNPQQYQARVYAWDPLKGPKGSTTGSPLYSGGLSSIGGTNNLFETVAITTGGVFLPGGGKQYALLLTAEGLTGSGGGEWGFPGDVYPGGSFVFTNYPISQDWDNFFTATSDLAFSATLREVPGPLPIAGASMAFAFSRKLRRRVKGAGVDGQC